MSKVVMALGGNALGNTPEEQKLKTRWIAKVIADMVEDGHHLVICHGNGPQVGMIHEPGLHRVSFAERYNQ